MTTTTKRIAAIIRHLAGTTIFSCRFIKRTTGEERLMVCRLGVTKHLSNGEGEAKQERAYDPIDKGLLPVWDMQKQAYRSISLDSILSIKIAGVEYQMEEELARRLCECCQAPLPVGNDSDLCADCLALAPHVSGCTCGEGKCGYHSTLKAKAS